MVHLLMLFKFLMNIYFSGTSLISWTRAQNEGPIRLVWYIYLSVCPCVCDQLFPKSINQIFRFFSIWLEIFIINIFIIFIIIRDF